MVSMVCGSRSQLQLSNLNAGIWRHLEKTLLGNVLHVLGNSLAFVYLALQILHILDVVVKPVLEILQLRLGALVDV